tara:strand:- start:3045 stop:3218 length:174 start_codon:yes stop_codon:yes gene_type:complete
MNREDIIYEIEYLKKKTVLLEKILNTKQTESVTITSQTVLNDNEDRSTHSYKKRSIC